MLIGALKRVTWTLNTWLLDYTITSVNISSVYTCCNNFNVFSTVIKYLGVCFDSFHTIHLWVCNIYLELQNLSRYSMSTAKALCWIRRLST